MTRWPRRRDDAREWPETLRQFRDADWWDPPEGMPDPAADGLVHGDTERFCRMLARDYPGDEELVWLWRRKFAFRRWAQARLAYARANDWPEPLVMDLWLDALSEPHGLDRRRWERRWRRSGVSPAAN